MVGAEKFGVAGLLGVVARYARPYRRQTIVLVGLMLLDLAVESCMPLSLRLLIDKAIVPRSVHAMAVILVTLAVIGVAAAAAALTRDWLYARVGTGLINDLRLSLFSHLQRLSMNFYAKSELGDILSRFSNDIGAVENTVVSAVPTSFRALIGLLISAGLLFSIEWRLALISVLGVILCFLGAKRLEPRATREGIKMREAQGRLSALLQENLGSQGVVKGFCLERYAMGRFSDLLSGLLKLTVRANFLGYLVERIPNVGVLLLGLLVTAAGSLLAFQGNITLGELVAFQGLFVNAAAYVEGFTWAFPQLLSGTAGAFRVEQLLSEKPQVFDAPGATVLPAITRDIEFRDITFGYTEGARNLDRVSFRVPAGSWVAFVGASGSGKSTVLTLVLRFYDPRDGSVLIDGHDLRGVQQESVRAQMGAVFQDSVLFNTTIRENIRVGCRGASDAAIEEAAKKAGIHEVILQMPDGYDTVVGDRGGRLSGGQRQRIGIARALLRNPSVLILDEATSALDPATEAAVNATLGEVRKGRTVLSVTHRLSASANADVLLVMDKGRVVEQGSHAQLLAMGGFYAGLWAKQNGVRVNGEGDHAEVSGARLKAVPLFAEMDQAVLDELARDFGTEHHMAERTLVHEGDPGDKFYVIARGKVAVTKRSADGSERRVAVLSDGDYFGELALLKNVPRSASIQTLTDGVFLVLGRDRFCALLRRTPQLYDAFMAANAKRNSQTTDVVQGFVSL